MTTQELFGRDHDLMRLRNAWDSERTRILSIEAFGGIGKSALVNTWLDEMKESDYHGAERVVAWSFYSQGTKENLVSADEFVGSALRWFGIDPTRIPNPGPRARGLPRQSRHRLRSWCSTGWSRSSTPAKHKRSPAC